MQVFQFVQIELMQNFIYRSILLLRHTDAYFLINAVSKELVVDILHDLVTHVQPVSGGKCLSIHYDFPTLFFKSAQTAGKG